MNTADTTQILTAISALSNKADAMDQRITRLEVLHEDTDHKIDLILEAFSPEVRKQSTF